ncbi:bifunctional uridylate/adenylate kinase [Kappamyces sp. JEL0829]|nr:bifunctional uridylate/adenylate kinase [Kappamyces sp. JEL0829]
MNCFGSRRPLATATSGNRQSGGQGSNARWSIPLFAACAGGLGYYYYSQDEKKKSPLDSLTPIPGSTVIFVLGGPGAGKGTQCAKLVDEFHFVHLSAGDLLREERNRPGSPFGELINTYIAEGQIVPMEITVALLHAAMKNSTSKRFLIDGFPRKMDQALKFEEKVADCNFVLYFDCPEAEMLKRLLKRGETSGRVDDNIESIKKRFDTFRETSYPVVSYYDKLGKVRTVFCQEPVDKVYAATRKAVLEALNESK